MGATRMKRVIAKGALALGVLGCLSMLAMAEQSTTQIASKPSVDVDLTGVWLNGLRWNGLRWNGLPSKGPEGQSLSENRGKAKLSREDSNPFFGLADQPIGK